MLKVALVFSTFTLGLFSFQVANTYNYLGLLLNNVDDSVSAGVWSLIGWQLIVLSFGLALGFIIHSRKR
jgi:hypothetical protein